jgi:hypothetical protein
MRLPVLLASSLLTACASEPPRTLAVIDTLPGGIVQTIASSPADSGKWSLVLEREVAPAEGEPGELSEPTSLALADDGTLYVVDQKPNRISVFLPDGTLRGTIGGEGSGPGEFQAGFIALRGDTLALQDPGQSRLTTWLGSTGEVLAIRPTACCYWSELGIDGRGHAWVRMMSSPATDSLPAATFLRLALAGGDGDTVHVHRDPASRERAQWVVADKQMRFSMLVPFSAQPVEAVDPTGGVLTAYGANYVIRRTSDGRDTVALFGRTHQPLPISDAERRAVVEEQIATMVKNQMGSDEATLRRAFDLDLVPRQQPAIEWLHVDGAGRTWARQATGDTTTATFDLFDREGRWLDQLRVADADWAKAAYQSASFAGDRVAVLGETGDGLPVVRIYRLVRTE